MNLRQSPRFLRLGACALLLFLAVTSCGEDSPMLEAPVVTETLPPDGAFGVPTNTNVAVIFDTPMSSIDASHFTLSDGESAIAGTITMSADGRTCTFYTLLDFAPHTIIEGAILADAVSASGVVLGADHRWNFATGESSDWLAPTVVWRMPGFGAVGVPLNQRISVTFSEPMDPTSITAATLTLRQGAAPIVATVTYSGVSAILTPWEVLEPNTVYTVMLSVGAVDLAGNLLESAYEWRFTTGDQLDSTPPTVNSSSPPPWMVGVAPNQSVTVTFSEPMDPSSISAATLTMRQGVTPIPATVTYAGLTATLRPKFPASKPRNCPH